MSFVSNHHHIALNSCSQNIFFNLFFFFMFHIYIPTSWPPWRPAMDYIWDIECTACTWTVQEAFSKTSLLGVQHANVWFS